MEITPGSTDLNADSGPQTGPKPEIESDEVWGKTVVAIGDSITWGAWDHQEGGWVNRLRTRFERDEGIRSPFMYNCGICGDQTVNALFRFDMEVRSRKADIVIVAIGINDAPSAAYWATPKDLFRDQYSQLLDKAQTIDRQIVVTPTNVIDGGETGHSNAAIAPLRDIIVELATARGITVVDMFGKLIDADLHADKLHLSESGHQRVADEIYPALLPMIQR